MDKELKAKWCTALRSGEYKQGYMALEETAENGNTTNCCLGVLCRVAGISTEDHNTQKLFDGHHGYLTDKLQTQFGITNSQHRTLAQMNDQCTKFPEIADYIEKNL